MSEFITTIQAAELTKTTGRAVKERAIRAWLERNIERYPELAKKHGNAWLINEKEFKKVRNIP